MGEIVPTILSETAEEYKASVERLQSFARRVHVDISDGEFTPSFLVAENQLYWPPTWQVDVHAMVARPSEHIAALIALKPSLIIIHAEIQEDRAALINQIKAGNQSGNCAPAHNSTFNTCGCHQDRRSRHDFLGRSREERRHCKFDAARESSLSESN